MMCSDPKMSVHHAEFKLEGHAIVYEKWKWKTSKWSFNLHPCASPLLLWPNVVIFGRFGMVRSRETTFMLNTFSFEACIMMNFELEVWEIKHI